MKKKVVIKESDIRRMVAESVRRILKEEFDAMNSDMTEKAKELVHKVKNWSVEEIVDVLQYNYVEALIYGEVEDENGGLWCFHAGGYASGDGDEVYDVDYDGNIDFEAPDGTEGTIEGAF